MNDESEQYLTPLQKAYLEANPEAVLTKDAPLQGVGGWLGFLAISLVALGPIITIVMTVLDDKNTEILYPEIVGTLLWSRMLLVAWISTAIFCLISICAGWMLLKRLKSSTIPIVIACLWIGGPGLGTITLVIFDNIIGSSAAISAGEALARPFVYSIVWTIYLLRSRRVRNTYHSEQIEA